MDKSFTTLPKRFISIKEAEELYGISDYHIKNTLTKSKIRAKIVIDRSVRYDKDILDDVIAGMVTATELPLYKRFLDDKSARYLYGVSHNTLEKIASMCGAKIKIGKRIYYDMWELDKFYEEHALW